MSGRIIFIFGGIKSGKSKFVIDFVSRMGKRVTYVATSECVDEEMRKKIKQHQKKRPKEWLTIEEPINIVSLLDKINSEVVIIECLTTYISNLMLNKKKNPLKEVKRLLEKVSKMDKCIFIISNEVGHCLVPENKLGREFINIVGEANQMAAEVAHEVYFIRAGISDRLK
jgi:adenosylcobinamide kinase/adenosylcobinamide-phosphate guanylyltransferase